MTPAIQSFFNDTTGNFRCYIDENGIPRINATDAAYGLGYIATSKGGVTSVKWGEINRILREAGYKEKISADSYLTESMFYLLAMRSDNQSARDFQNWAANEVFPSIRKQGYYAQNAKLDKWSMIRELGKEVRKSMTAAACRFYDYAHKYGDNRTKGMIIGQWTNEGYKVSGINKGERNNKGTTSAAQLAATILIEEAQRDNTDSGIAQGMLPRQIEAKNSRDLRKLGSALPSVLKNTNLLG